MNFTLSFIQDLPPHQTNLKKFSKRFCFVKEKGRKKNDYDSINYFKRISFSSRENSSQVRERQNENKITWICIVFNFQLKIFLL